MLAEAKDGSAPLRVVSPHKGGWQGQGKCTPRLNAAGVPAQPKCGRTGAGPSGKAPVLSVREPPADEEALAKRLRDLGKPLEGDVDVQGQRSLYQVQTLPLPLPLPLPLALALTLPSPSP